MVATLTPKHTIVLSHTLRSVALSFVSVYIPIFLLVQGKSLPEVIVFYMIFHGMGLVATLTVLPWVFGRFGLVRSIQLYFFVEVAYLLLLHFYLSDASIYWLAALGGVANMIYWIPKNILFLNHSELKTMGSDLGWFMGMPKISGVVGPIVAALVIPLFGFQPLFIISCLGLMIPGLLLTRLPEMEKHISISVPKALPRLIRERKIFTLEFFDNIIEEAEWYWPIFVYLALGSISFPGYIGAVSAIAGFLFSVTVGKMSNTREHSVLLASGALMALISFARVVSPENEIIYLGITFGASFVSLAFLNSYFTLIYRKIKRTEVDNAEFMIIREIPTIVARLVVFGTILLVATQEFFLLPIVALVVLLAYLRFAFSRERAAVV